MGMIGDYFKGSLPQRCAKRQLPSFVPELSWVVSKGGGMGRKSRSGLGGFTFNSS